MASIPPDSEILSVDEALTYFNQWTLKDRQIARQWIAKTGVTDFYVPPSDGYVAGHGGPNRSAFREMAVNGLVMHVGFLHAWPNDAEVYGDERIPLSHYREPTARSTTGAKRPIDLPPTICPQCHLDTFGAREECDSCGYDFAAAREASKARWRASMARRSERG